MVFGAGLGQADPIASDDLEASISSTLERPEFAWRLEVAESELEPSGTLASFFNEVEQMLEAWFTTIKRIFNAIDRWLERLAESRQNRHLEGLEGWSVRPSILLVLSLVAAIGILYLLWRGRRSKASELLEEAEVLPDLESLAQEESEAAEVEATRWLAWAEELYAEGRSREAIRALYLGQLSSLARRNLLILAFFKSNRDYRSELERKAKRWPELPRFFRESIRHFEEAWYGHRSDLEISFDCLHRHLKTLLGHEAIR